MHVEQPEQFLNPAVEWACTTDSLFTPAGEIIVLRVSGEVDLVTLPVLEAALNANLDQEPDHLLLDLAGVTYCCVRGIALLVTTAGYAAGQGVGYVVSGVPAWLDRIWQIVFTDGPPVRYRSAIAAVTAIQAQQARFRTDHLVRRGHLRSVPVPSRPAQRRGHVIPVLVVDPHAVPDAYQAGAAGYQLKSVDTDDLIEAARTVHAGSEAWDKRAAAALRRRTEPVIRPSHGLPL